MNDALQVGLPFLCGGRTLTFDPASGLPWRLQAESALILQLQQQGGFRCDLEDRNRLKPAGSRRANVLPRYVYARRKEVLACHVHRQSVAQAGSERIPRQPGSWNTETIQELKKSSIVQEFTREGMSERQREEKKIDGRSKRGSEK
jgi:hypothetical protein